jgi:hypothetical protein
MNFAISLRARSGCPFTNSWMVTFRGKRARLKSGDCGLGLALEAGLAGLLLLLVVVVVVVVVVLVVEMAAVVVEAVVVVVEVVVLAVVVVVVVAVVVIVVVVVEVVVVVFDVSFFPSFSTVTFALLGFTLFTVSVLDGVITAEIAGGIVEVELAKPGKGECCVRR